jgi:hypothetical protein
MHHGLAGFDQGGKMQYAIERLSVSFRLIEKVFKVAPVCKLTFNKLHPRWQQILAPVAQIVVHHRFMTLVGQQSCHCPTNVSCAARDQYLHKKDCPFVYSFGNLESITNGWGRWNQLIMPGSGSSIPGWPSAVPISDQLSFFTVSAMRALCKNTFVRSIESCLPFGLGLHSDHGSHAELIDDLSYCGISSFLHEANTVCTKRLAARVADE